MIQLGDEYLKEAPFLGVGLVFSLTIFLSFSFLSFFFFRLAGGILRQRATTLRLVFCSRRRTELEFDSTPARWKKW